jgi:hypothetical protein
LLRTAVMRAITGAIIAVAGFLAWPGSTSAEPIILINGGTAVVGRDGGPAAEFSISGSTLTVKLRNARDSFVTPTNESTNTLTGLVFDLPEGISLEPNADTSDILGANDFATIKRITVNDGFATAKRNTWATPLIEDEIVLVMAIAGGTLSAAQISNVTFQHGSDVGAPQRRAPTIPEPTWMVLFGLALFGVAMAARRLKPASQQ